MRRNGSQVAPSVNLGMPIAEVQSAGPIVIRGGIVNQVTASVALVHGDDEITIVDTLLAFIDQNPSLCRTWIDEVAQFTQDLVLSGAVPGTRSVEPVVH